MIRSIKNYITRIKVEKALGIKLYDWQKEYLFNCDTGELGMIGFVLNTRGTGKTLAHQLKLLLDYKAPPLDVRTTSPSNSHRDLIGTTDYFYMIPRPSNPYGYTLWYIRELVQLYEKLKAHNIKVREIIY